MREFLLQKEVERLEEEVKQYKEMLVSLANKLATCKCIETV